MTTQTLPPTTTARPRASSAPAPSTTPPRHRSHRASAALIGVLYIVGTLAGTAAAGVSGGGVEGPDYVADAASIGNGLATGSVLVLIMGISLAFIPVVAYPVLSATASRLALGYLVFRGALEGAGYLLSATGWLVLFNLGRTYEANDPDSSGLRAAGESVNHLVEISGSVFTIAFLVGAALFYTALWQGQLVPRWLAGWGLVGIVPYAIAAFLRIFAVIEEPFTTTEVMLSAPLGIQEMVLAGWLIVRGFNRTGGS